MEVQETEHKPKKTHKQPLEEQIKETRVTGSGWLGLQWRYYLFVCELTLTWMRKGLEEREVENEGERRKNWLSIKRKKKKQFKKIKKIFSKKYGNNEKEMRDTGGIGKGTAD